jgi:hypothetical protein
MGLNNTEEPHNNSNLNLTRINSQGFSDRKSNSNHNFSKTGQGKTLAPKKKKYIVQNIDFPPVMKKRLHEYLKKNREGQEEPGVSTVDFNKPDLTMNYTLFPGSNLGAPGVETGAGEMSIWRNHELSLLKAGGMDKILDPGKTFLDSLYRQSNNNVVSEKSPYVRPRGEFRRKGSDKDPSNSRIEPISVTNNGSFCNSNGNKKKYASPHWPITVGFDKCLSTHYLPTAPLSRQFKSPAGTKKQFE